MKRCKKLLTQFQRLAGAQDGGDPEEQSSEGCKWQQHKRRGDWWSSQFSHALIIYYSQDCSAAESTKDAPKDRTTLVVFIGLLIDLLGEKKLSKWPQCAICSFFSAFTLILPLFPALIGHYRENDSSGLFAYLETKVLFQFKAGL